MASIVTTVGITYLCSVIGSKIYNIMDHLSKDENEEINKTMIILDIDNTIQMVSGVLTNITSSSQGQIQREDSFNVIEKKYSPGIESIREIIDLITIERNQIFKAYTHNKDLSILVNLRSVDCEENIKRLKILNKILLKRLRLLSLINVISSGKEMDTPKVNIPKVKEITFETSFPKAESLEDFVVVSL